MVIGYNVEMLDDILKRIDQRLEALGLSESRAAIMAGLSNSTIRDIRRKVKIGDIDRGVSTKTLAALAPVLETTVAWLAEGVSSDSEAIGVNRTDVPLISSVSAGQPFFQEGIDDFSDFPTIAAYDLPKGEWIALRVDGLSMSKISPPDSIILVNMADKELIPNAYYIIMDEAGDVTYKRFRPGEKPPFQPFSYQDIKPLALQGDITIIGRVRRTITDM